MKQQQRPSSKAHRRLLKYHENLQSAMKMKFQRNQLLLLGRLILQVVNGQSNSNLSKVESLVLNPNESAMQVQLWWNDGQWAQEEHEAELHNAQQAVNAHVWDRQRREEAERENREYERQMEQWSAAQMLSGPLDRLNAILSLLQPLDRYRTPFAIGSAIGTPYPALSCFHAQLRVLNRLVLNRFGGSTAR